MIGVNYETSGENALKNPEFSGCREIYVKAGKKVDTFLPLWH